MTRFFTPANIWRLIALVSFGVTAGAAIFTAGLQVAPFRGGGYEVPAWAAVISLGSIVTLLVAIIPTLSQFSKWILAAIKTWRKK